ncbi:Hypothetical protein SRAE_X000073450 [Strongyloides ratti]|uniref:Uncharacterized protein n=1 Tax=Strongyloides ratti TaxID=34506 RepID=A0A090LUU6_STRRB|nr:Hypothetical protein SRAE_X000073450 [Strongyloides ratti]CEF71409.1 Hypothetical protein SRAE_X000073450 [Strongyloides ratti]
MITIIIILLSNNEANYITLNINIPGICKQCKNYKLMKHFKDNEIKYKYHEENNHFNPFESYNRYYIDLSLFNFYNYINNQNEFRNFRNSLSFILYFNKPIIDSDYGIMASKCINYQINKNLYKILLEECEILQNNKINNESCYDDDNNSENYPSSLDTLETFIDDGDIGDINEILINNNANNYNSEEYEYLINQVYKISKSKSENISRCIQMILIFLYQKTERYILNVNNNFAYTKCRQNLTNKIKELIKQTFNSDVIQNFVFSIIIMLTFIYRWI